MKNVYFTVFTPVYNRKDKIHRVWESLNKQTFCDFEWIIVDDGSTDGVEQILREYKEKATFSITILRQQNSGKHIAWNRAVKIARGELFVPADSDDAFVEDTLEFFYKKWQIYSKDEKEDLSGINVLCKDSLTENVVGDYFPFSGFLSNNLDLAYKYKVRGEKWGCIKVTALKQRVFPEVKSSHMSESWIWFWLARKYNVVCYNKVLRIYYQNEGNALSDKPSYSTLKARSRVDYIHGVWNLNENIDYLLKYEDKLQLFKKFLVFWRTAFLNKKNVCRVFSDLNNNISKILAFISVLPGYILFVKTKLE
ncbi:MAG: glycosyltransferase family 2 protein [Desulforegulaceae bacterium]|nr:glycosyltransferase family 2 protein [Desulforegulaceae bacterium]